VTTPDIDRSLENLRIEYDAIALYDALATIEKNDRRAAAFRTIAGNERRHAAFWADRLRASGADVPAASPPRPRVRLIIGLARLFGTHFVSDMVKALEGDEESGYTEQGGGADTAPEHAEGIEGIVADEREHAAIWRRLDAERAEAAGRGPVAAIAVGEEWHRAGRSGTLRAVIFGVSDGLVSNLALVVGVAGATTDDSTFIVTAGIAGLLAGAFSMAAGEYISMQSQRELYERQIALERAELEAMPEEEEAELAALYRAKGFTSDEAATIARRLLAEPERALDTLVREELGLDPDELGSPWGAAAGSFVAFGLGALVPVLPYLVASGPGAFAASVIVSLLALFAVGAGVSLLTGRGVLFSGLRQVAIGAAAAGVTYAVGSLIGVAVT
jgi:VIT1/CCC1 family predicted Fe2+/Mn2+ transporter